MWTIETDVSSYRLSHLGFIIPYGPQVILEKIAMHNMKCVFVMQRIAIG